MKKIIPMLTVLVLVVHVYISLAQQPVVITITKGVVEEDLAGFNIYVNDDTSPTGTIDAAATPWLWRGEITLINGNASVTATAFDTAGNESERSRAVIFNPPPDGSDITITIIARQ